MNWISVKDKLPAYGQDPEPEEIKVLILREDGTIEISRYTYVMYSSSSQDEWIWAIRECDRDCTFCDHSMMSAEDVTHWMQLPEKP